MAKITPKAEFALARLKTLLEKRAEFNDRIDHMTSEDLESLDFCFKSQILEAFEAAHKEILRGGN